MKDFWKRVYLLYPKAVTAIESYAESQLNPGMFYSWNNVLPAMQIGLVLQFIADNEWVSPKELVSELYAPSGDFVDNGQQLIEELLETLENRI